MVTHLHSAVFMQSFTSQYFKIFFTTSNQQWMSSELATHCCIIEALYSKGVLHLSHTCSLIVYLDYFGFERALGLLGWGLTSVCDKYSVLGFLQ